MHDFNGDLSVGLTQMRETILPSEKMNLIPRQPAEKNEGFGEQEPHKTVVNWTLSMFTVSESTFKPCLVLGPDVDINAGTHFEMTFAHQSPRA
jgi:hypothetical protein